jgi:NADPH-dependent curcumin reductase CurA
MDAVEVHLARRPSGWPVPTDFAIVKTPIPPLGAGDVLVRNEYLSVDPYMRGRMDARRSYVEPFKVGAVMDGGATGTVTDSRSPRLAVGDRVLHRLGWRDTSVGPADQFVRIDDLAAPTSAYLGVLGSTGLTAYVGLLDIAGMRPGDNVFISGAAGAVGSVAGQIARLRGAGRVIGSAGTSEKVDYLRTEAGFDAAFSYRDGPVLDQLVAAAPDGIDVFFDNVGGEHLEAAIEALTDHGRVALCGAIAHYNATEPQPGPNNMFWIVKKRLALQGFIITDHLDRREAFLNEVGGWLRDGSLAVRETIVEGIENMPDAFLGMLHGANLGKMLIRVNA